MATAPLITQACTGELFGHALAVAHASANIFEIFTSENAEILFLYVPEFTSLQNCNCTYRFKVMENLMQLIAKNNMELMMKIRILTQGSLRKKLMLYFFHSVPGTALHYHHPAFWPGQAGQLPVL